jgi:hypothetical protein
VFRRIVRRWVDRTSPSTDQTAAETRRIAEDALRATETLKVELQEDQQATASLIAAVKPKEETPRRFAFFAITTVLCGSLVLAAAIRIPAAFSAPPPNYGDPGVVGLYVWANPLNKGQARALDDPGLSLSAMVDQRSARVKYVATFPKALAGDRFVIALSGTAVLSDFGSSVADVSNEYPECQPEGNEVDDLRLRCQLVTGIIPSASKESPACHVDGSDGEMISVRFSGDAAHVTSSYDWAHHVTSLPYLGNVPGAGAGNVDGLVSGAFGANFPEANVRTCYNLLLNPEWTDYTPNFAPTLHIGDVMSWDPASEMAVYLVVSTERGAAWKGNALVALVGVFGGAFLTLLVATARSGHRLYSQAQVRGRGN